MTPDNINVVSIFDNNINNKPDFKLCISSNIKQYFLVLDLDETLVHSVITSIPSKVNELLTYPNLLIHYIINDTDHMFIFYRPYLLSFLTEMNKYFNIYVFTNGTKIYAQSIITMINNIASEPCISKLYTRSNIYPYYKYISDIDGLSPLNSIIIDDCINIWKNDSKNVINIKKFLGPDDARYMLDKELKSLKYAITSSIQSQISNVYDLIDKINKTYLGEYIET